MKQRIITGIIATCVLIPVLIFSWTPVLPVGIAFCSVVAVYEMFRCVGLKRAYVLSIPMYILAGSLPLITRFLTMGSLFVGDKAEQARELPRYAFMVAVALIMYYFAVMTFSKGKYKLADVCVLFTSLLYILCGFNAIVIMHDSELGGNLAYLTIFIGAWITDIFAYFCGVLFGRGGKHKLIPDVSPKKTVEGSIGGILFCVLFMVLFGVVCNHFTEHDSNLLIFALGGFIASVVAQVGDLQMSVIKRTYGIKDFGSFFPGHGGMLDRFDSILAVAIALMCYSSFFNFF